MKRTLILILLLFGLVGIYWILGMGEDSKMTELKAERDFSVRDISSVNKIVITERNKLPTVLERQKDKSWKLNQEFVARPNAVNNLLEVIQQIQIKFIPEQTANKNVFDELRSIGVQVDVYAKNDQMLKSYTVGGSTPDERGAYILMRDSKQPFVVQIPSIEGSIRGRFILSELDWRERAIIKENKRDLNYVQLKYRDHHEESFTILMEDSISPKLYDHAGVEKVFDANKLKAYLEGYDAVYAEYIDNLNPLRDSISKLDPFAQITFGRSSTENKAIKLYPLSELMYEDVASEDLDRLKVEGRYFADCSWGDFMLVQQRLIGKLLRGSTFFDAE